MTSVSSSVTDSVMVSSGESFFTSSLVRDSSTSSRDVMDRPPSLSALTKRPRVSAFLDVGGTVP